MQIQHEEETTIVAHRQTIKETGNQISQRIKNFYHRRDTTVKKTHSKRPNNRLQKMTKEQPLFSRGDFSYDSAFFWATTHAFWIVWAFVTSYVARVRTSSENASHTRRRLISARIASASSSSPMTECISSTFISNILYNSQFKTLLREVYISASFINSVTSEVSAAFPEEEVQYLWTDVAVRATARGNFSKTDGSSLSWRAPMLIYSHLPGGGDMDVRDACSSLSTFGFLFADCLTFLGEGTGPAGFDGDGMSAPASDAGRIWRSPATVSGSYSTVDLEPDAVDDAKWGREASSTTLPPPTPRLILNFGTLEKWKPDIIGNNQKSRYDGRIARKMVV
ncbi:Uncharacterized protein Fot_21008 [Forsythia ovata]|uniref:Uncharacterized protein n=1 Tax=Forsythia ovata TaxID=205694 RepID=A0ABD1UTS7_9LAMI